MKESHERHYLFENVTGWHFMSHNVCRLRVKFLRPYFFSDFVGLHFLHGHS